METFEEVVDLATAGCRAVAGFMREQLLARVRRMAAPRQLAAAGGGSGVDKEEEAGGRDD